MKKQRKDKTLAPECNVKYSQIREIAEKVVEINKTLPEGEKVINLSLGQNFIGNPQPIFERIDWFKNGKFESPILYEPSLGSGEVRDKIGNNFYPYFYDIPEDYYSSNEIMITDGAFGAGRNAFGAILTRGDLLVIDRFTFRYFINTLQILGRGKGRKLKPNVKTLPSTREENYLCPPETVKKFLKDLKEKNPGKNIVYYTQFGFNPTGCFRSEDALREIAQFIGQTPRLFLINDLAYHLIRWENKGEIPLATYLSENHRGIVDIDTLSKPFGLMGARVGCLLTKDRKLFKASARVQQYSIVSPNKFSVDVWHAIAEHISDLAGDIRNLNENLKERKKVMEGELQKVGIESLPSHGGLYTFLRVPEQASTLWKPLIEKAKVAGVPGNAFTGDNDSEGEKFFRFTIALPKQEIKQATQRLYKFFA
ncbi:MAG: pyridoxal phosphate-dependent aminotransferase [Candidatus Korarchaeota archaeon]|nr:pyridoxal phosphate-dependent aminotransferase [Candidatus Korarchaeota archaeon]NIU85112.1 aminotransferase class I/II-fold pyridoxal phosphate-dependent enzyme [Candidatus Thorarchaeota archaeon]NIW15076.1 aminotransferase class I/II-fold pyridoxal phosphate-dependent enzyme [Candidatus Thorarchaeota archaeon]NIW53086.1 aminotransferase class I/II-fold pyridoxal phosphate-dependent enzyme [Candidatus Korarchaeota archaeon]